MGLRGGISALTVLHPAARQVLTSDPLLAHLAGCGSCILCVGVGEMCFAAGGLILRIHIETTRRSWHLRFCDL